MRNENFKNDDFHDDHAVDYKIENLSWITRESKHVVATVSVDIEEKLDLNSIMRKVPDAEYNPERFPGVIMRIEDPKATFLIFSTGNMVVTGLRLPSHAKRAVEKVMNEINEAGVSISNPRVKIVNIVASGKLGVKIDLNMAAIVMEHVMYEPEVFPGLMYRLQDPKAVFLIYSTGSIVCTGVRDEETVKNAILKLNQQLRELDLIMKDMKENGFQDITFF